MDNPASFKAEAAYQGRCAVCGTEDGPWHAHHVIAKQICRVKRVAKHDPRNALRLCAEPITGCHWRHEQGQERVPLVVLTADNIAFALEVLSPGPAVVYLQRYYSGEDPRIESILAAA